MNQYKFTPLLMAMLLVLLSSFSMAEPASVIEAKSNEAIKKFYKEVKGSEAFLSKVKGYIIFPSVIKAGFVVGGEYGEGVLRVNAESKMYYSMTAGTLGFQAGVQQSSYILAFVSQAALDNFMNSNGWEAGVDGAITVVKWNAGKDLTSLSYEKPIYAFVFNAKGLMYNLNLKGTKFSKLNR